MKKMREFKSAVAAGMAVAIGATSYLMCDVKLVGAFLFSVALFAICAFNLNLYTGKIGYFFETENKVVILTTWLGNLTGSTVTSVLIRLARPEIFEKANSLVEGKMEQNLCSAAILAFFCGVMMFTAIHNHNKSKSDIHKALGIVLCIMAFIVCGFEHSIADMCYFWMGTGKIESLPKIVFYILLVSLFNGIGAITFNKFTK